MRAFFLAVMALAVLGIGPALGQNVLHAVRLSNYGEPLTPGAIPGADRTMRNALFTADCVLAIGNLACVDLWTLKESRPHHGWTVRNMTDGKIEVVLGGCEIHNGSQTIVIDEGGDRVSPPAKPDPFLDMVARHQQPGPFDQIIGPYDTPSIVLINHTTRVNLRPLEGQRPFQKGVTLSCTTATAKPAP